MTSARVLATQQARDAANQLVQLTQQLKDEIGKVNAQGDKLADPNQWDGKLAQTWRNDWGNDKKQLQTASQQLDDLEKRAKQAVEAIIQAGGG
jgi:ABC-type transporter Mla subunit MlaD